MSLVIYPELQPSLLQLLLQCSSLNFLELDLRPGPAPPSSNQHIPLNIKSLSIIPGVSFGWHSSLFSQITLPDLSSLRISLSEDDFLEHRDITPLLNLLARSSSPITSLHLAWVNVPERQWLDLLHLTPRLEDLEIVEGFEFRGEGRNNICTSQFFNELYIDRDATQAVTTLPVRPSPLPLVPHLRNLVLHVHLGDLDFDKLYQTVMSRCPDILKSDLVTTSPFKCLRSLEIDFYIEEDGDSGSSLEREVSRERGVERLKSLKDFRLKLVVGDLRPPVTLLMVIKI
ncbi:hypothetical protein L218DRAFT_1003838 [Marasmius fiardii PR-910]|nr:hypothetical protein L218DRAFT_1003838 [Marasmius fiardii PR-910]